MRVYLLEWDNGECPMDHECVLLGVYSSEKERDEAQKRYETYGTSQWPFARGDWKGQFVKWSVELNEDLVPRYTA